MNVLVVDVGGTHVKILATGQKAERRMDSGPAMTAAQMAAGVRALAKGWKYHRVAIGYPGVVARNKPAVEPHNLGKGWVGFDYETAFGCPVRIVNDAMMQALGGYKGGKMLFLGFGTGLGTAMIVDGVMVPMELAHLPYRKATFEDYVGEQSLLRNGKKKWRKHVTDVITRLSAALEPEDIVLGGGNAAHIADLPPRCRIGPNENAFPGGFRLWADGAGRRAKPAAKRGAAKRARKLKRK
ncbi:MAG TPA: ROK family protein [Casimicrobiaceae bacterium]|nr:ROK family protein [Casimicrobiaceae bacterium]